MIDSEEIEIRKQELQLEKEKFAFEKTKEKRDRTPKWLQCLQNFAMPIALVVLSALFAIESSKIQKKNDDKFQQLLQTNQQNWASSESLNSQRWQELLQTNQNNWEASEKRIELTWQSDEHRVEQREKIYAQLGPLLNTIYCYCQNVGDYADYKPKEIIAKKRKADRIYYSNYAYWSANTRAAYMNFESNCFQMYTGEGKDAQIKVRNQNIIIEGWKRKHPGQRWESSWDNDFYGNTNQTTNNETNRTRLACSGTNEINPTNFSQSSYGNTNGSDAKMWFNAYFNLIDKFGADMDNNGKLDTNKNSLPFSGNP